jgi:hypothetical protein
MNKINVYVVLEEANESNGKECDTWGVVRQDNKQWLMYGDLEGVEQWLKDNSDTHTEIKA